MPQNTNKLITIRNYTLNCTVVQTLSFELEQNNSMTYWSNLFITPQFDFIIFSSNFLEMNDFDDYFKEWDVVDKITPDGRNQRYRCRLKVGFL